jgi:soluble lytic murein transglycosylase-like protein
VLHRLGRKWLLISVALLVIGSIVATTLLLVTGRRSAATDATARSAEQPEAPPDLIKLREPYAAGVNALAQGDGAAAVRHLTSFDFGNRRVEEYRLRHLAAAYRLTGDTARERLTLAQLWSRSPRLVYADDAGLALGQLYAASGSTRRSSEVFASVARRTDSREVAANARWAAVQSRLELGDVGGALYSARSILIHSPRSEHAENALAVVRALTASKDTNRLPLTPSERIDRAIALMQSQDPQTALEELTALSGTAGAEKSMVELQKGIALRLLRRYEDSNRVLEPLTSGPFKYAIPALSHTAKNYTVVAAAINPEVTKTVKEKKRVGSVKVRVGKGKKRRTVTKPKYKDVFRQVKLIDLAKKNKKDEYNRLASERLKDLLSLEIDDDLRLETLNALIARAAAKNQDDYVQELVQQVVKIDAAADPALQHFWDKGWAAYSRGDLATAQKLFRFIADTYSHVNVRRQSEYWYARAIERQGRKEEAAAIYQKLADAPYADLYAIHSVTRGAKARENRTNPLRMKSPTWNEIAEKEMPDELRLAYELTALASLRDAQLEIRRNARRANSRFAEALLAEIHHTQGSEVLMYRAIRRAWPQLATVEQDTVPVHFLEMYYPLKYGKEIEHRAKERGLDPNLVRALILQESYYDPTARSRVGATGLMQLMPPTAKEHAARLRIPFAVSRLENPDVNVRLGTFHLKMLIDMFRGNTYLAVASYNAGQGNVLKWRRAAPGKPLDEFLESIPFSETRNYVKRVTMLRSSYERLTL